MPRHYLDTDFNIGQGAGKPTDGIVHTIGRIVLNSNATPGQLFGWRCISAGTASNSIWKANDIVALNSIRNANNKVYRCKTAGTTGNVAPSHTSGDAVDGTAVWTYVDVLAVFEELFSKAAPQPNSTAADVATLVADFNNLLSKLRAAGLLTNS